MEFVFGVVGLGLRWPDRRRSIVQDQVINRTEIDVEVHLGEGVVMGGNV